MCLISPPSDSYVSGTSAVSQDKSIKNNSKMETNEVHVYPAVIRQI